MKKILITKGYTIENKTLCICGGDPFDNHAGSCDIERRQKIYHEKQIIKPISDLVITIEETEIKNNSKISTVKEEQLTTN